MKYFIILAVACLSLYAKANVVGVDAQNFNPTTSGIDFVTVQSSKTLSPGIFNFGVFFNYAVNTLPHYEDVTQQKFEPEDTLLSTDLNIGYGIMDNWDVGISIPQIINQTVNEDSTLFRGFFEQTGVNEIRINSKYRIWDGLSRGIAVIGTVNWFLIEDYPYTGTDPGPTFNLELAYDSTINRFQYGVNVGYRFRNEGDPVPGIPVAPFSDQIIGSIATSYNFTDSRFKIIAEIFSSFPAQTQDDALVTSTDREVSTAEALIGGKLDFSNNIAAHAGAGTELFQGTASPDWRIYAGLNWSFGPFTASTAIAPTPEYDQEELKALEPAPVAVVPEVAEKLPAKYIDEPDAFINPPKNEETFLAKNVLFEFNGTGVNPEFNQYLEKLANYVVAGGFTKLIVIGHTDSVGSDAYNMNLSDRRATSVKNALVTYLPEDHRSKVTVEAAGEGSPLTTNATEEGRSLNRRVEFFIKRN